MSTTRTLTPLELSRSAPRQQRYMLLFSSLGQLNLCLAEVDALLVAAGYAPALCYSRDAIDPTSVVLVVTLPSDAEAARVFRRAVLIKYYLALWNSPDCGNLHDACNDIRNLPATYLAPYLNSPTWRTTVDCINGPKSVPLPAQAAIRSHLGPAVAFSGDVRLDASAAVTLCTFFEFSPIPTMCSKKLQVALSGIALAGGGGGGSRAHDGIDTADAVAAAAAGASSLSQPVEQTATEVVVAVSAGPTAAAAAAAGDPSLSEDTAIAAASAALLLRDAAPSQSTPHRSDSRDRASATCSRIVPPSEVASLSSSSSPSSHPQSLCTAASLCSSSASPHPTLSRLRRVYVGVRHETSRHLCHDMALTSRAYVGPTTLDAELALAMTNIGCVGPGSLVLEPFVGTGSVSVAIGKQGGTSIGTDIDFRVLVLGKAGFTVASNFEQYGLGTPELVRSDNSIPALRRASIFDAIVTDPPYGVRAGARKSGSKRAPRTPIHTREAHIASTQVYAEDDVIADLLATAARMLRVGGRLVYLLPACSLGFELSSLPSHPGLELVSATELPLSLMLSRFVVVMRKIAHCDDEAAVAAASVAASVATSELVSVSGVSGGDGGYGDGDEEVTRASPVAAAAAKPLTLKNRIKAANIEWLAAQLPSLETLRRSSTSTTSTPQRQHSSECGETSERTSTSVAAAAAATATTSTAECYPDASPASTLDSGGAAQLSRNHQKFIRKRMETMINGGRKKAAAVAAAAAAAAASTAHGIAATAAAAAASISAPEAAPAPHVPSPQQLQAASRRQLAKQRRAEGIASGEIKLHVSQMPFSVKRPSAQSAIPGSAAAADNTQ